MGIPTQYGIQGIPQVALNGGLPQFSLTGLTPFGQSTYTPINEWDETWDVANSLTKVHKSHTFKAGFEGIYLRFATYQPADPRGSDSFTGVYTSIPGQNVNNSGAVQFVLTPTAASVPGGIDFNGGPNSVAITRISVTDARRSYFAGYFQDDWKVARKLTVNLGLRYEYFPAIIEEHDAQSNFIAGAPGVNAAFLFRSRGRMTRTAYFPRPSPRCCKRMESTSSTFPIGACRMRKRITAPRIGFAYRATDKLVVTRGMPSPTTVWKAWVTVRLSGAAYPFAFTLSYSNTSNQTRFCLPTGRTPLWKMHMATSPWYLPMWWSSAGVTLRKSNKTLRPPMSKAPTSRCNTN